MGSRDDCLVITCEHGGNRIPQRYRDLFHGFEPLLQTHRGYDPGALTMAKELSSVFSAPLFVSTVSRLLVDLNRSTGHPRLHFESVKAAAPALRREVMARHYLPYRSRVEAHIAAAVEDGHRVVHISSHSFTPELDGEVRNADIGLLYDPGRPGERHFAAAWHDAMRLQNPALKIRRNYPYTGKSDGFTAYLRRRFPDNVYIGIELEINQKYVFKGGAGWRELRQCVIESLLQSFAQG
jgi:predicted N-formylglutamate amidohydrolase